MGIFRLHSREIVRAADDELLASLGEAPASIRSLLVGDSSSRSEQVLLEQVTHTCSREAILPRVAPPRRRFAEGSVPAWQTGILGRRSGRVLIMAAVMVVATAGLAIAGALPHAMQRSISSAAAQVGVSIPDGRPVTAKRTTQHTGGHRSGSRATHGTATAKQTASAITTDEKTVQKRQDQQQVVDDHGNDQGSDEGEGGGSKHGDSGSRDGTKLAEPEQSDTQSGHGGSDDESGSSDPPETEDSHGGESSGSGGSQDGSSEDSSGSSSDESESGD